MNTVIYTIAKNEEHNAAAFMEAAEGAPVYILDTGSTDNTVDILRDYGAHVAVKTITPWRFDYARQAALELVPDDPNTLCVSVDMDERIESGWQDKLAAEWNQQANYGNYRYIGEWLDKDFTQPAIETARTRIHSRQGFHWERPVHEVPVADADTAVRYCDTSVLVRHYPDGKQRNYVPLLTSIIEADLNDADARLQRGGEYFQKREWACALADYQAWLQLTHGDDNPVTRYRRATTHIALAHCYYNLNDHDRAIRAFWEAVAAEPTCREGWVHLAHAHSTMGQDEMALGCAKKALAITQPPYYATIDSFCWGDYATNLANDITDKLRNQ